MNIAWRWPLAPTTWVWNVVDSSTIGWKPGVRAVAREHLLDGDAAVPRAEEVDEAARCRSPSAHRPRPRSMARACVAHSRSRSSTAAVIHRPRDTLSRQLPQRTVTPVGTSTKERPLPRHRGAPPRVDRRRVDRATPCRPRPSCAPGSSVSRMTVRQALQELSNAGLVDRQRGRGTFVAARPMHRRPGVFLSFTEEMARRGMTASSRFVSARARRGPAGGDRRPPPRRRRRRRARRAGAAGRRRADRLRGRRRARRSRGGARRRPRGRLAARRARPARRRGHVGDGDGHRPAGHRAESRLLEVAPRTALLVELRLLFDQHGRPFERTESRYVADRYVIDVVHTTGAHAQSGEGRAPPSGRSTSVATDLTAPRGGSIAQRAAPIAPAWGPSLAGTISYQSGGTRTQCRRRRLAHEREQRVAGLGDAAADDDALGDEHGHDVGDGDAEVVGDLGEGGRAARSSPAAAAAKRLVHRRRPGEASDRAGRGERFETAAVAAPARRSVGHDHLVGELAGPPIGPKCSRPSTTIPPPIPVPSTRRRPCGSRRPRRGATRRA